MYKTYNTKITVAPINKFYFGGEKTFNTASGEANYFAKSNKFPQQTGLLGLLRYAIGSRNGFDKTNIGLTGFRLNGNNDFGHIQYISPLFLESDDKIYFQSGINFQGKKTLELLKPKLVTIPIISQHDKDQTIVYEKYDLKAPLLNCVETVTNELRNEDDFFDDITREGNSANTMKINDDDGFYKQTFYKFRNNEQFVFYANLIDLTEGWESILKFGGESSMFKVKIEINKNNAYALPFEIGTVRADKWQQITLQSDCLIDEKYTNYIQGGIFDSIPFRYIETTIKTTNHNNFKKTPDVDDAKKINTPYNLLKKGSILISKDTPNLVLQFNNESMIQIGYNYYSIKNLII